jgi:methionyl-tRNA formyltransferase
MKLDVLCSDAAHPVMPHLRAWQERESRAGHEVHLLQDRAELSGGDLLFLVSCSQIIGPELRARYGATRITVCLLEAAEPVDSGAVWLREEFELDGSELLPEINARLFEAETSLMSRAVRERDRIVPQPQSGDPGPYLRKRTPEDSRLDPDKTLASQFDLLRVVDSRRFPAFFDLRGHRYVIRIEKVESREHE